MCTSKVVRDDMKGLGLRKDNAQDRVIWKGLI
jgi:hypothetical protein